MSDAAPRAFEVGLIEPAEFDEGDAVIQAAYAHEYGPSDHGNDPFHRTAWRSQHFDVLVARDAVSHEILGSVTMDRLGGEKVVPDATDDELGFRLLATSPTARRRGVGETLVRRVLETAAERGLGGVFMKSEPFMVGAHALYRKLGFERDPSRDGLWHGDRKLLDLEAFRARVDEIAPVAQH
jgi:ribosomal protein S18 acetylase RimI-like enzyme